MNNLKQPALKDNNKLLSTSKNFLWDTFGSPTTRNIPINKTIDPIKVTGITIENVSGVKELENVSSFNRKKIFSEITKPSLNSSDMHSKSPKHGPNAEVAMPPNKHQDQTDPALTLLHRESSWSEPILTVTKDRGDSIVFSDVCEDEISTVKADSKRCLGNEKPLLSKKRIVKGLLYIKNAGDTYKSEIEAKKLQVCESDIFKEIPRFKQVQVDGKGDFDIAIFLSGLVQTAVPIHQEQTVKDFERKQQEECKDLENRTKKRKNSHINKNNAPCDKSYQFANQPDASPAKWQRAKKCDMSTTSSYKSRLTYQIKKTNVPLDLSGDDSDEEYELNESGNIVSKRKTLDNNSSNVEHATKLNESGRLSCISKKSATSAVSSGTRRMTQSSLSRGSDGYGFQKPKISEQEMWENFEMIFKSYASTSRHSGGIIPRKISTEWMINAGVVNGILTQKKADDAFRSAAGAKITMNAQEYKEFLISLSLKSKRSYYEIYRRMCGM